MSKNKKSIILIGLASPPLGGEALSFLMFSDHLKQMETLNVLLIDKVYKHKKNRLRRFINPLRVILIAASLIVTKNIHGLYLTCGQSSGGILRDGILVIICHLFKVPVILHLHGGGIKSAYESTAVLLKRFMKYFYQKPKCIIVLGKSLRDQFFFLKSQEHIRIIVNSYYNDTPIIDLQYDNLKKHDHLKLIYLSHVLPSKGLFDVLEALLILQQEDIPFEFNFGGEIIPEGSRSKKNIQDKIQEYQTKFGNQFIIHSFIGAEKKWKLLAKSNVFLLPTQFYGEGQPISIIEALYAGNCIITTRYRGIPDLVKDGINGWFVNSKDPKTIANKLKWLWYNPEKMKKMSIKNHEQSLEMYSPKRFLDQMTNTVNTMLKQ